jgi:hypothetical protein
MEDFTLYRYPFDREGTPILTFDESLGAMVELERELNGLLKRHWRWCDVDLKIVERHPTYVIYEVVHYATLKGYATVMPFSAHPQKLGSEPTTDDRTLHDNIRARGRQKGA